MDSVPIRATVKFGSTALEEILCGAVPTGSLGNLVPHAADAWSVECPGLDSLPKFDGQPARLRICIATEDIVGPVRNGGIGTTYAALAELLARLDHDVTILYLKGQEVENGTIEHWIEHYAAKNVRFVPVPNYAFVDRFQTGADRWLHGPYNMLKYLIDNPMDVVHVSEWRGSGYLSLLAKRQGVAFEETLFIVKTSSPWIWNRLYGSQPLDRLDDLAKVHAERRSVEFADMVIGGSLHLLRWMASQGYRIPRKRTFVQPNVATFDHLGDLFSQRSWPRGARHSVNEIVFFGRLESRKGLFIFVQAIKRLLRQGKALPPQITFMGKPGARLTARPDQDIVDYIKSETANWPTKIEILTELQQYDALKYLLSGDRLAVMPSMIENSSLAVYEAAVCGIPFIASASGGTPELVAAEDHEHVLCESHPIPVAEKIAEALDRGGYVARPSFDNDANLEQWRRFHLDLGRGLLPLLQAPTRQTEESASIKVSVCIYHADNEEKLRQTLDSLKELDHAADEVLLAVDTDDEGALDGAMHVATDAGVSVKVISAFDLDAGQAFNQLSEHCQGDFLLFLWAGSTLRPMALRALTKVATSSNADVVNYFFRVTHETDPTTKDYLSAIIFGGVAQAFFRTDITALPLLVRRTAFATLGGFSSDYRVLAHDHEFVAKAQISGVQCETALLELGTVPAWDEQWLRGKCYDQSVAQFRAIRPELAATPLALRELLLMSKGLQRFPARRAGNKSLGKAAPKKSEEKEGPLARLMNALSADLLSSAEEPKPAPVKPPAAAPKPVAKAVASTKAAPVKAVPARAPLRGAGLIRLIDDLSAEHIDEPETQTSQPKRTEPPQGMETRARIANSPRAHLKPPETRSAESLHWLSNVPGKRFSGRILGVHQGVVYGWAKDEDRPQDHVDLEVIAGASAPRGIRADAELPTAFPIGKDVMNHGFVVPVWSKRAGFRWDWRFKSVVVRIKEHNIQLGKLDVSASPTRLEAAGYDGFCDVIDTAIRGWVWRPADPEMSIDVAAFVDGKFLGRTTAHNPRDDLRSVGIGNGNYGFTIPVPKQLRDGTPHSIDVVVAESGVLLKRGRLQLVGDILIHPK